MSDALLLERDGGVLTLTNNDAPINRMSFEYMDAVEEALNAAAVIRRFACSSSPPRATRTSRSA